MPGSKHHDVDINPNHHCNSVARQGRSVRPPDRTNNSLDDNNGTVKQLLRSTGVELTTGPAAYEAADVGPLLSFHRVPELRAPLLARSQTALMTTYSIIAPNLALRARLI